jgi:hypothetical protein
LKGGVGDAGQERWPLGGLAARPKGPGALQSKPGEVWPTRQADQLPWGLPEGHIEPKEAQRAPQPAGPCPYAPRPLVDQGEVPGRERARPGGRYQRSHPGRRSGGGLPAGNRRWRPPRNKTPRMDRLCCAGFVEGGLCQIHRPSSGRLSSGGGAWGRLKELLNSGQSECERAILHARHARDCRRS